MDIEDVATIIREFPEKRKAIEYYYKHPSVAVCLSGENILEIYKRDANTERRIRYIEKALFKSLGIIASIYSD